MLIAAIAILVIMFIWSWISSYSKQEEQRNLENLLVQEMSKIAEAAGPKKQAGLTVSEFNNWAQVKKRNPFE